MSRSSNRTSRSLSGWHTIFQMCLTPYEKQRKIALHNARIKKLEQDLEKGEVEIARKSDQVVLADLDIEIKKLKLKELQQKMGVDFCLDD
jgi:hypothetical protein